MSTEALIIALIILAVGELFVQLAKRRIRRRADAQMQKAIEEILQWREKGGEE